MKYSFWHSIAACESKYISADANERIDINMRGCIWIQLQSHVCCAELCCVCSWAMAMAGFKTCDMTDKISKATT